MNYNVVLSKILEVFQTCGVRSFPIDCHSLLQYYHYRLFTYSELYEKNPELYEMCFSYSEDAFRDGSARIIAYNESMPKGRIRFSLMHELGHIMLNHKGNSAILEQEANFFASNILAPRIAIHYSCCKNSTDIASIFHLTLEASEYAFKDYKRWHRMACYHMSLFDKAMYRHFYHEDQKCFVYHISFCQNCQMPLYNSSHPYCSSCTSRMRTQRMPLFADVDEEMAFSSQEYERLYGFLS